QLWRARQRALERSNEPVDWNEEFDKWCTADDVDYIYNLLDVESLLHFAHLLLLLLLLSESKKTAVQRQVESFFEMKICYNKGLDILRQVCKYFGFEFDLTSYIIFAYFVYLFYIFICLNIIRNVRVSNRYNAVKALVGHIQNREQFVKDFQEQLKFSTFFFGIGHPEKKLTSFFEKFKNLTNEMDETFGLAITSQFEAICQVDFVNSSSSFPHLWGIFFKVIDCILIVIETKGPTNRTTSWNSEQSLSWKLKSSSKVTPSFFLLSIV
ncbi:hypothetical protein RFI_08973, partial [Reticulomyxa filosa]